MYENFIHTNVNVYMYTYIYAADRNEIEFSTFNQQ
jgi:hypothetical protein